MNLLERLRLRRDELREAQRALHQLTITESRDLSTEEQTTWSTRREEIGTLETRITELEADDAAEKRAAAANADVDRNSGIPKSGTEVKPRSHTYRKNGEHDFVRDAFRAWRGNSPDAAERMAKHTLEMRDAYAERFGADIEARAGNSGNYSGFVVPIYAIEEYAALARAGRPFANIIPGKDLPPTGMQVNISRITTGSTSAAQATEGTAASEQDIDDTLLTINVVTIDAAQTVSFQALDRGAMTEDIVTDDLTLAYHTELDRETINGAGSSGEHLGILNVSGINAVTFTSGSPTVALLIPKVADGIQQINAGRFAPGTYILMAPRRWGWIVAAVDSNNRPLVVPDAQHPYNAQGVGDPAAYGTVVGTFLGLPVITDGNVPTNLGAGTNEDRIVITRHYDHRLWEEPGSPIYLTFDRRWSPVRKNLQDVAVVYGYSAYTAGRYPKATSVIAGTGLATPTF